MRDDDSLETGDDAEDELIDINEVCELLGGKKKPLNKSTVYRNISLGNLPPPIHPTPGISRFSRKGILAARKASR
jgi:predicted DNA-binding transcriptional regulator AlpA